MPRSTDMGPPIRASEITPEQVFHSRRQLLKMAGGVALTPLVPGGALGAAREKPSSDPSLGQPTPIEAFSSYNNYYEYGWDKTSPSEKADSLKTSPWIVTVDGLCEKPLKLDLDALRQRFPQEERLCRFRCVEAWSAVVPWQGLPLRAVLEAAAPLSSARFVRFTSVMQPESMPSQRENKLLVWPYVEGLRLDEANHPLTLLATGMYGRPLLPQNGAPVRLVVPWKYGFKSLKALVRIELVEHQPLTSWQQAAPDDYGFYANVNPAVPHPRWSQATERPLADPFYGGRRVTELFNGYGESVAALYQGMDLRRDY